jgi:hypothetical protein
MMRSRCVSSARVTASSATGITNVYVLVSFNFIGRLDASTQQFLADAYYSFSWCDERLSSKLASGGAFNVLTDWQPQLEFTNALATSAQIAPNPFSISATYGLGTLESNDPNIACKAWGIGSARYYSFMVAELQLASFPFDSQVAELRMESSLYTADQVQFVPGGGNGATFNSIASTMLPAGFAVIEWTVNGQALVAYDYTYPALYQTYNRLTARLYLTRQPQYYLTKFMVSASLRGVRAQCEGVVSYTHLSSMIVLSRYV